MPVTTQKQENGIVQFDEPYYIDFAQFCYAHLDCDSIILDEIRDDDLIGVVCFAASENDNSTLQDLFDKSYRGKGYCIMRRLGSESVDNID